MSTVRDALTPEEVARFHDQGFLAVDAITTQDEVAQIREIYDAMFARQAGREAGDQFDLAGTDEDGAQQALPQIIRPTKYAPELEHSLFRKNAQAIARQLVHPDACWQGEHAILKPARYGAATPWHQDEAYSNPAFAYNVVSFWMPLQDATVESGCMQFIPGSHRLEVQPHHSINRDPRIHGLEIDEVDDSTAVACPIPAGGCTMHTSRTLHYAGPNTTAEPRRALVFLFGLPPVPLDTPRVFEWNDKKKPPREAREAAWKVKEETST